MQASRRQGLGVVYTPEWLADLVVRETLALLDAPGRATVCDPTCGDGRFLLAAGRAGIPAAQLFGVDRDAGAVSIARKAVPGATLIAGEALLGLDWSCAFPATGGMFDVLVGNPPFVRIQHLRERDPDLAGGLAARYSSATGNFDLYGPVLELALERMRQAAGFVVPHRFFKTEYGRALREALRPHVAKIVDFGDRPVFGRNAQAYVCALVLRRVARPTFTFTRAWDEPATTQEAPVQALSPEVWLPLLDDERRAYLNLCEAGATPLHGQPDSPAEKLFVGLQTPSNRVYRLEPVADRGDTLLVRSEADPEPFEIEKAVTRKLLMGADIRSYRIDDRGRLLLLPYAAGLLLDLPRVAPHATAYLGRHQPQDRARWWEWPYPKNLGAFEQSKLLVGGVAARGRYAFDEGGVYHVVGGGDGGYSLVPRAGIDPWALLGLLGSSVMDFALQRRSAMFAGRCYSYGRRFLAALPIRPASLTEALAELARSRAMASGQRAAELDREIDRHAGAAYGVTRADWAAIRRLVVPRKV